MTLRRSLCVAFAWSFAALGGARAEPPQGYSIESASRPAGDFAVVAIPGHRAPTVIVAAVSATRMIARPQPQPQAAERTPVTGFAAGSGAPVTLALRCPARVRACPATAAALASVLRDAGVAVVTRPEPVGQDTPRGVSYVFEEDRAQALRIAGLVFGTDDAERVPARTVHDPRPGLVEINLAG